jgi:tetratricopeptide (TPR) repeat protein
MYIQTLGGQVYHVSHLHRSLSINAFLTGTHPEGFPETRQAWTLSLDRASPDDLFAVKKALERQYDEMTLPELLAHLRLSGWDAHIFLRCADSLEAQASTATAPLADELCQAVERIWENYYFIGEARDLPFHLASLLYALGQYARALEFWGYSHELMGPNPTTFYNRALCYSMLGQDAEALTMLAQSLAAEPAFTPALEMQARLEAQGLDSDTPTM